MYADLVLMKKNEYMEKLANYLGFGRVFFLEDLKKLKIKEGRDINYNRQLIKTKNIKILLNPHSFYTKDKLNQRNTGLNQVLLKLANKNKIMIGLSLDQFSEPGSLGRIKSIIKLCRKYKVKICVFSLAKTKYDLKGASDIISLLKISGMAPGDANIALENILS